MATPDCSVLVEYVYFRVIVRRWRKWCHVLRGYGCRWFSPTTVRTVSVDTALNYRSWQTFWWQKFVAADIVFTWFRVCLDRYPMSFVSTDGLEQPRGWSFTQPRAASTQRQRQCRATERTQTWTRHGAVCWRSFVKPSVTQPPGEQLETIRWAAGRRRNTTRRNTRPERVVVVVVVAVATSILQSVARRSSPRLTLTSAASSDCGRSTRCTQYERWHAPSGNEHRSQHAAPNTTTAEMTVMYFSCYWRLYSYQLLEASSDVSSSSSSSSLS